MLIRHIAYHLPETIVTNADLEAEYPEWDMKSVGDKSGVGRRHIAASNETALDLAEKACEKLFTKHPDLTDSFDGLLFCTQSPDFIMPSNAFLLQKRLGLKQSLAAFDFNLACSGYVYGLVIANGLLKTNMCKRILFVTADTYSKYINPGDRSTRVLFGDGAAVTVLEQPDEEGYIIDALLASSGYEFDSFYIPAGGCRTVDAIQTNAEPDRSGNLRTPHDIHMNGFAVWKFISRTVPAQINTLLERNNLTKNEIDFFVFHQASKLTLDSLQKQLQIPSDKMVIDLEDTGNLVSSSIPVVLKKSLDAGRIKKGDRVLMSGFGVGLSWGTLLLQF